MNKTPKMLLELAKEAYVVSKKEKLVLIGKECWNYIQECQNNALKQQYSTVHSQILNWLKVFE